MCHRILCAVLTFGLAGKWKVQDTVFECLGRTTTTPQRQPRSWYAGHLEQRSSGCTCQTGGRSAPSSGGGVNCRVMAPSRSQPRHTFGVADGAGLETACRGAILADSEVSHTRPTPRSISRFSFLSCLQRGYCFFFFSKKLFRASANIKFLWLS